MIAILRKNVTLLFTNNNDSCYVCLGRHLFSSSTQGKLVSDAASPAILDLLLHKHRFSPKTASKIASALNRVKAPQNADSILSFLKDSGFSNAQLEKIFNYKPRYLMLSLEHYIKPKVRVLEESGICASDDIAKIISSNPVILGLNLSTRIIPSLSTLKSLLETTDAMVKLLRRSSWFLITDLGKTLIPNIEFLKSRGVPMERILKLLFMEPRCMLLRPGILRESVLKAEEMGISISSKGFIYAVRVLSTQSGKTLELKLQVLQNCGFSESDVMKMFATTPQVFSGSAEKFKRVKDLILATGKYDVPGIVKTPTTLSRSIEKRYKPRFLILQLLESKNLIEQWPTLASVSTMTDEAFFKRFVGPYLSEIGKVCVAESSEKDDTCAFHVNSPAANSKLVDPDHPFLYMK